MAKQTNLIDTMPIKFFLKQNINCILYAIFIPLCISDILLIEM